MENVLETIHNEVPEYSDGPLEYEFLEYPLDNGFLLQLYPERVKLTKIRLGQPTTKTLEKKLNNAEYFENFVDDFTNSNLRSYDYIVPGQGTHRLKLNGKEFSIKARRDFYWKDITDKLEDFCEKVFDIELSNFYHS
jgi:uncharacterized protein YutD